MKLTTLKRGAGHFAARVRKWWAASCLGLLLLPGLGRTGGARAQAPPLPPKTYMNKTVFYLPILIEDKTRSGLREIHLYGKDDPSRPWVFKAKEGPNAKVFSFRPTQDGEYWFTVVTVDKLGRQTPADVSREAPGVIVVHDSQPPVVGIRQLQMSADGQLVQCEIRDLNPDPAKTRFEYQTADRVWRAGDSVQGQPDTFVIPTQAMFSGMVRVIAVDRAGNESRQEVNLACTTQNLPVAQGPPCPSGQCPTAPGAPGQYSCPPAQYPAAQAQAAGMGQQPRALPPAVAAQGMPVQTQGTMGEGPVLQPIPVEAAVSPKQQPQVSYSTQRNPMPSAPVRSGGNSIRQANHTAPAQSGGQPSEQTVVQASPYPGQQNAPAPANRKIVGNNHVSLEYQIESVGQSGVGKVEIWVTADQGQSWQRMGEDADRRSPVEIDLPGEGLYGVSLAVSNGRGFGATPPAPGDTPDYWVEVDVTKPFLELGSIRPGTGDDAAALWIQWNARDKNLAPEAVDMYYSPNRDGPWHLIAKGVRNDGRYRWVPPHEMPLAFLRVAVTDKAGNSTKQDTPQAVALDDMTRPRAHVMGVAAQGGPNEALTPLQAP